jgi:hypothetical protein
MKHNIWTIIFIGLGIICILIGITSIGNQLYTERVASRIIILGVVLIILSLFGMVPNRKSDNIKEAEKFNFRETDTDDNCGECNRFDNSSFDGFDVYCKFFHIKTDENHICDLLQPQLDGESINNYNTKNSNKHIADYNDLLRKIR